MQFHSRNISIITDSARGNAWLLTVHAGIYAPPFNKGAGYIGGFTFYAGRNCRDHRNMYAPRKRYSIGITRNAQRVPWLSSF
jgi:hypothetical protein